MKACRNCGTALEAVFCPRCGQRDIDLERPIPELAREVIRESLDVDGRMFRTLRLLFLRPGELTREYLAGHRQRFTPPLRLYLVISVVFFLAMAFAAGQGALLERGQTLAADAPGQAALLSNELPRIIFLLLPVFALLLKLAFRRRLYFDHLIHAFHIHSAAYVLLAVILPLERAADAHWLPMIIQLGAGYYLLGYLMKSVRRVYDVGWGKASSATIGILVVYLIMLSVAIEFTRGDPLA